MRRSSAPAVLVLLAMRAIVCVDASGDGVPLSVLTTAGSPGHAMSALCIWDQMRRLTTDVRRHLFLVVPTQYAELACSRVSAGFAPTPCKVHRAPDLRLSRAEHSPRRDYACEARSWLRPVDGVNILAIDADEMPAAVTRAYRLDATLHAQPGADTARMELSTPYNFARNSLDELLLPFGVRRVAYLDTDAQPGPRFIEWYNTPRPRAKIIARSFLRSANEGDGPCEWTEGWNFSSPLVRGTLGPDDAAADLRRFRASAFVVLDVRGYCRLRIADKITEIMQLNYDARTIVQEKQRAIGGHVTRQVGGLYSRAHHQPPFVLALANHTVLDSPTLLPEHAGSAHCTVLQSDPRTVRARSREMPSWRTCRV